MISAVFFGLRERVTGVACFAHPPAPAHLPLSGYLHRASPPTLVEKAKYTPTALARLVSRRSPGRPAQSTPLPFGCHGSCSTDMMTTLAMARHAPNMQDPRQPHSLVIAQKGAPGQSFTTPIGSHPYPEHSSAPFLTEIAEFGILPPEFTARGFSTFTTH